MRRKPKLADLVAAIIAGTDLPRACRQFRTRGRRGVDALLNALEGKSIPVPEGRYPQDLQDDLTDALHSIATKTPGVLIEALHRRPRHAFSLIWALGGLSNKAAIQTLIAYSTHKDMWVRWAAVEGLARLRKKSLLEPMLAALGDRSDTVRFSTVVGLEAIADERAIEPIRHYLSAKRLSPGGKRAATRLLAKLTKAAPASEGAWEAMK